MNCFLKLNYQWLSKYLRTINSSSWISYQYSCIFTRTKQSLFKCANLCCNTDCNTVGHIDISIVLCVHSHCNWRKISVQTSNRALQHAEAVVQAVTLASIVIASLIQRCDIESVSILGKTVTCYVPDRMLAVRRSPSAALQVSKERNRSLWTAVASVHAKACVLLWSTPAVSTRGIFSYHEIQA